MVESWSRRTREEYEREVHGRSNPGGGCSTGYTRRGLARLGRQQERILARQDWMAWFSNPAFNISQYNLKTGARTLYERGFICKGISQGWTVLGV
jgi:hypothetical protein